jgi:hypothetical protein
MQDNSIEQISGIIAKRKNGVTRRIVNDFKGTMPFPRPTFLPEEKIYHVTSLLKDPNFPYYLPVLIQEYGETTVKNLFDEVNDLVNKRNVQVVQNDDATVGSTATTVW